MRWLRFESGSEARFGIVEGEFVEDVDGTPFAGYSRTGRRFRLSEVRILVPVVPPTFYACGVNYLAHIESSSAKLGIPFKVPRPIDVVGYRSISALTANDQPIVIPADSPGKIQFEGELAVVIGKKAKGIPEKDALSYVLGYTIGNDVSERTWQHTDRTFLRSKNSDTFKPMGPWIETDVDLDSLTTKVRLNGVEVSSFKTNDMICGVALAISTVSRYVTLWPGDVIWMGTNDPTLDMVAGDVVEVEISGIGTLRNPVTSA